ncbi:MAG: LamG domain-containing protein, partial [Cyclobacteriaceae bacterium]
MNLSKLYFLTSICISFFVSSLKAQFHENSSLNQNLLIYYPFSCNSVDLSGNTFDGIVNAPLTSDRFSNPDNAYQFDGIDDYINLPNESALKPALPVTVAFWMNMNSTSLSILTTDFGVDVHSGVWFSLTEADGKLGVSFGDGLNTTPGNRRTRLSPNPIDLNTWYFVTAVVSDADNIDLYLNYKLENGDFTGSLSDIGYTDQPGSLGRKDGNNINPPIYFDGTLDEFYYWDRALTSTELEELFDLQKYPIQGPEVICGPGQAEYLIIGHNNAGYSWEVVGGEILSGATTSGVTVLWSDESELGTISVTVIDNVTNCERTYSRTISIGENPRIQIVGPTFACISSEYSVNSLENATYSWSINGGEFIAETNTQEVSVMWDEDAESHSVTSTIQVGECVYSDQLSVTLNTHPEPNILGNTSACELESYLVELQEGDSYSWEISGGTILSGSG